MWLRVAILGVLCLSFAPVRAADPTKDQPLDPKTAAEVQSLLEERYKLLRQAADQLLERYKAGKDEFAKVIQAERDVLKAALDLHEKPDDRVAALRKCLDLMKEAARITEARVMAGQGLQSEALQAKAAVLELQVELLREEAKAKPRK
jgi:outer membrane protein TolC